jgi:hypothetical protein
MVDSMEGMLEILLLLLPPPKRLVLRADLRDPSDSPDVLESIDSGL